MRRNLINFIASLSLVFAAQPNMIASSEIQEDFSSSTISETPIVSVHGEWTQKLFVNFYCTSDCGMFRTFASLVGMLYLFEYWNYAGFKINFGIGGLYYDPNYGPNWWEYYFEPVCIGNEENTIPFYTPNGPEGIDCAMLTEFTLKRKHCHQLLSKYVRLKPHMESKINNFAQMHFSECYVIGVHYRGTDKVVESPRASYQIMEQHILNVINTMKPIRYKIFVATDEQAFIDYLKVAFPVQVCFYEDAIRSSTKEPIHMQKISGYKKGEDAIIDCLLLSRCQILIKTSSNLSLFSTYFNPEMPVVHATERYWRAPLE